MNIIVFFTQTKRNISWRFIMENKDTIHLLKECDAGSKMAVTSIDEILESVQDEKLKKILQIF